MFEDLCRDGVLITVTMIARLPRKAKIPNGMFETATARSVIEVVESLTGIGTQSSSPHMPLSSGYIDIGTSFNPSQVHILVSVQHNEKTYISVHIGFHC